MKGDYDPFSGGFPYPCVGFDEISWMFTTEKYYSDGTSCKRHVLLV